MLPVTHGSDYTRLQILLYTILLFLVTLLPYLTGMSGMIYLIATLILNIVFLYYVIMMMRVKDNKTAMKTFWYSIVYITVIFAALLLDHYLKIS
jgi:protoheme IX farnesyltransferase